MLTNLLTLGWRRYSRNAAGNFSCDNIVAGDPAVFVISILKLFEKWKFVLSPSPAGKALLTQADCLCEDNKILICNILSIFSIFDQFFQDKELLFKNLDFNKRRKNEIEDNNEKISIQPYCMAHTVSH